MKEDFFLAITKRNKQEIMKCNDFTCRFGLSLTKEDVEALMISHKECLKEQQRIEFGNGILEKIIYAFCDSEYIYQGNYVETLKRLQNIFYLYKNESMDEMTDDELIDVMRNAFDGVCQGSLEYLEETCLEEVARDIRCSNSNRIRGYKKEDE